MMDKSSTAELCIERLSDTTSRPANTRYVERDAALLNAAKAETSDSADYNRIALIMVPRYLNSVVLLFTAIPFFFIIFQVSV